jgi:hypothetical protein
MYDAGKHDGDLFSTSTAGFPGGNKETFKNYTSLTGTLENSETMLSRILNLFNFYSIFLFYQIFVIIFIHFLFQKIL